MHRKALCDQVSLEISASVVAACGGPSLRLVEARRARSLTKPLPSAVDP